MLTVIDVFSKYAWAVKLKTKEGKEVTDAVAGILHNTSSPTVLQSDNGKEFKNLWMAKLCKRYNIKQIYGSPYRPQSQGCIERFNGTLKRMLYAHMTRFNTKVWADILDDVIANYRSMKHSSTGFIPAELHTTKDKLKINKTRDKMLKRNKKLIEKSGSKQFKQVVVGDYVRVSNLVFKDYRKVSNMNSKSYKPNWSKDIYQVTSVSDGSEYNLPIYTVMNSTGKVLRIYRDNLQLIPGPNPRVTDPATRRKSTAFSYREDQRKTARESRAISEQVVPVPMLVHNRPKRKIIPQFLLNDSNFEFN